MSNALQQMRDSIEVGDQVDVITRWGNQERLRRARVTAVVRSAARVVYADNGDEKMVGFKNIKPLPKPAPAPVAKLRDVMPAGPPRMQPSAPVPPPATSAPTPAPAPKAQPKASDEIAAWLQMGRDFLAPIEAEIAALSLDTEACKLEREALDEQIDANTARLRELHAQRDAIAKLTLPVEVKR